MLPSRIPVLIGLPGAGKTTLVALLAERLGLGVFRSDPFFRECRALPPGTDDPRVAITHKFLQLVSAQFPDKLDAVCADLEKIDDKGRCVLQNGSTFRSHGEEVFRAYEIEMLAWAHRTGVLKNKIPDLSASAVCYNENRKLFSTDNGYMAILVDTADEVISRNLLADYKVFLQRRADGDISATIRGAYELLFDEGLRALTAAEDRPRFLEGLARKATAEQRARRWVDYKKFAPHRISVGPHDTPRECADRICELLNLE